LAPISRRLFLFVPPAVVAATWLGKPDAQGIETLNARPLVGAKHASGADVKGFRHAQLKGWVTVVHVLSSAHPECADEMALWRAYVGDARYQIAGLFLGESEAEARDFIAANGNPYDALGYDGDGRVAALMEVRTAPSTLVFNPSGQIIHRVHGPVTATYLERVLSPIIEDASPIAPLKA
jgi:cytochrome c biogenesis protein CcmG/thiol:disulfide interchange protein DsbE